jgi:hypothetical protein
MTGVNWLGLPVAIREKARFRPQNSYMTNETNMQKNETNMQKNETNVQKNETNVQMNDVQWLDERALHQAVLANDPEAFAEMIRRFDPLVRSHLWRAVAEEMLEEAMAEFWIALIRDPKLREWDPELGGVLGQHLGSLAAQVARIQDRRAA